jgi:hypothetical protein
MRVLVAPLIATFLFSGIAKAEESAEDLAMKLSNPISSLISVPFQLNYDDNFGAGDDGRKLFLNVQPVIPITLNERWNMISRTIIPLVDQNELFMGAGSQSGLSDIVQSVFFSPSAPTKSGLIWGVGPVLLLPTGSDDLLTTDKWGAGPTAVFLYQSGPTTYGALVNHIESFAGNNSRSDISATFVQPFWSRTTPKVVTYSVNTEMTYDWESEEWSIPVNVNVSKLLKWGKQRVQIGGGVRYWAESPDTGPEGLGLRFQMTLLFPK